MISLAEQKAGLVMFTNSENGLSIADAVVKAGLGSDQPGLQWLSHPLLIPVQVTRSCDPR